MIDENINSQAEIAAEPVQFEENVSTDEKLTNDLENLFANEESKETEPAVEDGKQSETNDTKEVEFDWTKDGRYGKMWNNPNDVYKSYRNAENAMEELREYKNKYESIANKFSEKQLDFNNLDNYIEDYMNKIDPNNPSNKDLEILNYFLSKPEYETQIGSFFQDLYTKDLQARYPNMTKENIEKQMQLENEIKEMKAIQEKELKQKSIREYETKVKESSSNILKYSEERGFTPNSEQIEKFREEIISKNISPENFEYAFIRMFNKELDDAYNKKIESSILERLQKNNKTTVLNSNSINNKSQGLSFDDALRKALD